LSSFLRILPLRASIRTCGTRDLLSYRGRCLTAWHHPIKLVAFVPSNPAAARQYPNLRYFPACGAGGSIVLKRPMPYRLATPHEAIF